MNTISFSAGRTFFDFPGTLTTDISAYDNFITCVFGQRDRPGTWSSYVPGMPSVISQFIPGKRYCVYAKEEFTLYYT